MQPHRPAASPQALTQVIRHGNMTIYCRAGDDPRDVTARAPKAENRGSFGPVPFNVNGKAEDDVLVLEDDEDTLLFLVD